MNKFSINRNAVLFSLCLALLLPVISCKSVTSPDEEFEARILVYNNCGATVDIFLDSVLQFTISTGSNATINNLTEAVHKLDAFLTGTSVLVLTQSFDATAAGDYTWTIDGQASIMITNEYGETVDIYVDGEYYGYLAADDAGPITEVPFGTYNFEATPQEESTVISTITIEVTEVKEYAWTIR